MVHGRKLGAWYLTTAIVLRGVKCNDIIADYGKDTLCI